MEINASFIWIFVLSTIGFGYFIYGKKQKRIIPFASGVGLMLLPFLWDNLILIIGISLFLMILPYFIRL